MLSPEIYNSENSHGQTIYAEIFEFAATDNIQKDIDREKPGKERYHRPQYIFAGQRRIKIQKFPRF